MAKFLRLGTAFGSSVWKDIAPNDGDLYLQFDLAMTDPTGSFVGELSRFQSGFTTMFALRWTGTVWDDPEDSGLSSASEPPANLVWQTILMRWRRGTIAGGFTDGITEVTIDGNLLWSDFDYYDEAATRIRFENDSGANVIYIDNIKLGTTPGGTDVFAEDFEGPLPLDNFDGTSGDVQVVAVFDPPPVVPLTGPPTFEWRFIVTKLNGRCLALLDRIATQRRVTYTLNKPAIATGVVPSDSPTVNLVQSDGFPILDEGVRCLIGFRREQASGSPRWVARFAGIIEQVEDNVDENGGVAPYSTYTAYDPRQLLYARPVRTSSGALPGSAGVTFTGQRGDVIVKALLDRSLAADGDHYIGTFFAEATDVISKITFQRGASVGEALDQLTETGNCDIYFEAKYDPQFDPGSLATVTVFKKMGYSFGGSPLVVHKAPLSWDKPRRNLVQANRLKDGTQRANRIQYYSDADRSPVGTESDFASAAQYGDYWGQQFFPGANAAAVALLAEEQLLIRSKGLKTYKVGPVPGTLGQIASPILFFDYTLGTLLPIFASNRLRKEIAVAKRVVSIPVTIRDDGVETIEQLEFGEGEEEVS